MEKKDNEDVAAVSAGLEAVSLTDETTANQDEDDDDSSLFAEPPPQPDCDICALPLPIDIVLHTYQTCCGKTLCGGCSFAHQKSIHVINKKRQAKARREQKEPPPLLDTTCPFCRVPVPDGSSPGGKFHEIITHVQKRAELGDAEALKELAVYHRNGSYGLPKDEGMFLDMAHQAASHGLADAHFELGFFFLRTDKEDLAKARVHLKIAAKNGHVLARDNLGAVEYNTGSKRVAVRHWRISAAAGCKRSIDGLIKCFQKGLITKESLEDSMRARHEASKEFQSEERDEYLEYMKKYGMVT